jgi:hypothetical protein
LGVEVVELLGEFLELVGIDLPVVQGAVVYVEFLDGLFKLVVFALGGGMLNADFVAAEEDGFEVRAEVVVLELLDCR